jgi:ABC-2 type transport system ATP-binding protein
MQNLLSRIQTEHFVLDIDQALTVAPIVNGYSIELVDSHSINVAVEKTHGLNPLFQELSEQGIKVLSLKNKSNRLEQLFIDLVQ